MNGNNKRKFYNKLVDSFKVFLNPFSPVFTILVSLLITRTAENNYLKEYFTLSNIYITILLLWLAFCVFYSFNKSKNDLISNLYNEIEKKESSIGEMSIAIARNFENFSANYANCRIKQVIQNIVESFSEIDAIQVYKLSSYKINQDIVIKINHFCGFANELYDTNTIFQTYYRVAHKDYIKIKRIMTYIEKNYDELDINHVLSQVKDLKELLMSYIEQSKSDESEIIKEYCFFIYRFIDSVKTRIFKQISSMVIDDLESNDAKMINNGKRTGLLGCILLNDPYIFVNTNSYNSKLNRVYCAFPYIENNNKYLFSISFSKQVESRDELSVDSVFSILDSIKNSLNDSNDCVVTQKV